MKSILKSKKIFFCLLIVFVITLAKGQQQQNQPANNSIAGSDSGAFGWKESILGACLIGMAAYVLKQESEHRKERKEWQEIIVKQFEDAKESVATNAEVVGGLSNLLIEIKTLLQKQ
jgi:hypothetical protein